MEHSYNTNPMHIRHSKVFELFGGFGGLELKIQKGEDGTCIFQDMAHGFCAVTTILRRRFGNSPFIVSEAVNFWDRTYSCREEFYKEFFKNSTLEKYLKLRVTKQEPMIRLMRDMCITETGGFTPPESTVSTGYSYSFSMPTVAPSYVPFVIERDNTGLS